MPPPSVCAGPFRMTDLPGKGWGLVETRHIGRGENILTEGLLVSVRWAPGISERDDGTIPGNAFTNRAVRTAVDALNNTRERWFRSLADNAMIVRKTERSRFLNNAFTATDPQSRNVHSGVFRTVSRINHSCFPNAHFDWIAPPDGGGSCLRYCQHIKGRGNYTVIPQRLAMYD